MAQLETVSRELEALAQTISHDLNAPLRAVKGYTRMLEEDYGDKLDDEGRRIIQGIRDGTQRMARLIAGLLTYSRMGGKEMAPEQIDLGILIREVLDEARKGEEKRPVRFTAGPLPTVRGDRAMIRAALFNLLSNALKFSRPRELAAIEVNAKTGAEEVRITVTDNGIGFDAAYADKLFGVFQRLHGEDEFEGTGIGLALVRRIVERHGGRVWAESRPGEGATFGFSLPASPRPAGKGTREP
jgi:light-regulated signal transduction histidine kinase (bacteriophytochrome)